MNLRNGFASLTTAIAFVLLALGSAHAEEPAAPTPLAVGDALPALSLPDQHGKSAAVESATALLVFTRDMDGGGLVKEALAEGGSERLGAAHAVYVSDVSRMPGFVRSAFALPSMRKRAYPVLIDESGEATRSLPYQEGKATILTLAEGKITAVTFAGTSTEVTAALAGLSPAQ